MVREELPVDLLEFFILTPLPGSADLRRQRRAGLPRENPLVFYPRRVRGAAETHTKLAVFYLRLHRIRRRVERDPSPYTDRALAPLDAEPAVFLTGRRDGKTIAGATA